MGEAGLITAECDGYICDSTLMNRRFDCAEFMKGNKGLNSMRPLVETRQKTVRDTGPKRLAKVKVTLWAQAIRVRRAKISVSRSECV